MNYEKFGKYYDSIYGYLFNTYFLEDVGYEWAYLENEIYALRPVGEKDFIIVNANSPLKAYDKLMELLAKVIF